MAEKRCDICGKVISNDDGLCVCCAIKYYLSYLAASKDDEEVIDHA